MTIIGARMMVLLYLYLFVCLLCTTVAYLPLSHMYSTTMRPFTKPKTCARQRSRSTSARARWGSRSSFVIMHCDFRPRVNVIRSSCEQSVANTHGTPGTSRRFICIVARNAGSCFRQNILEKKTRAISEFTEAHSVLLPSWQHAALHLAFPVTAHHLPFMAKHSILWKLHLSRGSTADDGERAWACFGKLTMMRSSSPWQPKQPDDGWAAFGTAKARGSSANMVTFESAKNELCNAHQVLGGIAVVPSGMTVRTGKWLVAWQMAALPFLRPGDCQQTWVKPLTTALPSMTATFLFHLIE